MICAMVCQAGKCVHSFLLAHSLILHSYCLYEYDSTIAIARQLG
jgi:hypothetical protein